VKIKRSPETLRSLRRVLSSPTLMGSRARTASEDEIYERGEKFVEEIQKATPLIVEAGRKIGVAWRDAAKAWGEFSRSLPPARSPSTAAPPRLR